MKLTCKIILSSILVGCASVWLLNLIPLHNVAFLKFSMMAMFVGFAFALLASIIGIIISSIFLLRPKYRAKGILFPVLVIVTATLFFIFFLVLPASRALKMEAHEFDFVSIGTKVVLFDPDSPNKGITILDTSAHSSSSSELNGTCKIRNLSADLNLANHLTIEHDGRGVQMIAYSVQQDSIPFYPSIHEDEDVGISHPETSTYTAPTSTLIRINGELMNLGEAADRFPRIPPLGTD